MYTMVGDIISQCRYTKCIDFQIPLPPIFSVHEFFPSWWCIQKKNRPHEVLPEMIFNNKRSYLLVIKSKGHQYHSYWGVTCSTKLIKSLYIVYIQQKWSCGKTNNIYCVITSLSSTPKLQASRKNVEHPPEIDHFGNLRTTNQKHRGSQKH
jgi:hypothetical protein